MLFNWRRRAGERGRGRKRERERGERRREGEREREREREVIKANTHNTVVSENTRPVSTPALSELNPVMVAFFGTLSLAIPAIACG